MSSSVALALLAACGSPDRDGDGIPNREERELGLDPSNPDTDGDEVPDGLEQDLGLDPLRPDTDRDGATDGAELADGTDPLSADTDGDGVSDGAEVSSGTSPHLADTDGDTYTDGDETLEGTDPLDGASRIYTGYWPYFAGKDELVQQALVGEVAKHGREIARFEAVDQFGDRVDVYDFYAPGEVKAIILMVCTEWETRGCGGYAAFLAGSDDLFGYALTPDLIALRREIANGNANWITVLYQDDTGMPPDASSPARWHAQYPAAAVPVLADEAWGGEVTGDSISEYLAGTGLPRAYVLTGGLEVVEVDATVDDAMCDAMARLGIQATDDGWCR